MVDQDGLWEWKRRRLDGSGCRGFKKVVDQDVGGLKRGGSGQIMRVEEVDQDRLWEWKRWIRTDYESGRGQGLAERDYYTGGRERDYYTGGRERDYYTGGRERAMKHLIWTTLPLNKRLKIFLSGNLEFQPSSHSPLVCDLLHSPGCFILFYELLYPPN